MTSNTLPDDLNPAMIEVCARFIGKLTGLVPPPVADFPPEMHAAFRQFAADVYAIVHENVAQPETRAEVTDADKLDADRYRLLKSIPFGPTVPPCYRGIFFTFAVPTGKPGFIRSCRGEEMDAAIDAARLGEKQ